MCSSCTCNVDDWLRHQVVRATHCSSFSPVSEHKSQRTRRRPITEQTNKFTDGWRRYDDNRNFTRSYANEQQSMDFQNAGLAFSQPFIIPSNVEALNEKSACWARTSDREEPYRGWLNWLQPRWYAGSYGRSLIWQDSTINEKCDSHLARMSRHAGRSYLYSWCRGFIHLFITVCTAHCVENVESEALEAFARWSDIDRVVSFQVALKGVKWGGLSDRKWYVIPDFRGTVGTTSLSEAPVLLHRGTDNTFWLSGQKDRWGRWDIISKIKRDIGRTSRFFHTPAFDAAVRGSPSE